MYVSYNVNLAHIVGLKASIYISELININRKAISKNKLVDGFFNVDRSYIEQRTTLKEEEQKEIDSSLEEINILDIGSNRNMLKVNMDSLTGLILEKNKKIVDEASKIIKRGRPNKKESILKALKSYINTSNEELRDAYFNWIDAVMERQGWMSKESVIEGQKLVDTFTGKDLDIALYLIKNASINGWRDIQWAINDYKKSFNGKSFSQASINRSTELAKEVF
jgi:hypothetical protein